MAIFGNTTQAGSIVAMLNNIRGCQFNLPSNGSLTKITAWTRDNFGIATLIGRCAVYDTSGNLMGSTQEISSVVGNFDDNPHDYPFETPLNLSPGNYILAMNTPNLRSIRMELGAENQSVSQASSYISVFPNPATFTQSSSLLSIYATYDPYFQIGLQ